MPETKEHKKMVTIDEISEKTGYTVAKVRYRMRLIPHRTDTTTPTTKNLYPYSLIEKVKSDKIQPTLYTPRKRILMLQYYIANGLRGATELSNSLEVNLKICQEVVKEYNKSGCIIVKSKL